MFQKKPNRTETAVFGLKPNRNRPKQPGLNRHSTSWQMKQLSQVCTESSTLNLPVLKRAERCDIYVEQITNLSSSFWSFQLNNCCIDSKSVMSYSKNGIISSQHFRYQPEFPRCRDCRPLPPDQNNTVYSCMLMVRVRHLAVIYWRGVCTRRPDTTPRHGTGHG